MATKAPAVALSLAVVSVLGQGRTAEAQMSTNPSFNQAFSLPSNDLPGNASQATAERAPVYAYGVDAGVGETDNIALTPTHRVSQTMAIADADFSVSRQSRLFDVKAVGDFTYLDYLQNAFGSQLLGRFDGVADAAIVPGRLIWVLRDDFGQSALDPYTPVTPSNIEDINYVTTGPDLKWRLNAVNYVDASVRYARAQYQTSPFNSNRFLASVAVGRDISAAASLSLNANSERVLFDNTVVNTNFDRSSAFGRYELQGARTGFVGELGVTVVDQSRAAGGSTTQSPPPIIRFSPAIFSSPLPVIALKEPGGSVTGPLAKLELSRKLSPSAKVVLTAGEDLTDASSSFSSQTTGASGINAVTPAALTSDTYRVTYATAGWQYTRNRTSLGVTGRWERDIYPGLSSLDVTRPSAEFYVQRRVTRALTAQIVGRWYRVNYPHAAISQAGSTDYADTVLGASLVWRHGRGLEVRLRYDHDTYTASNGNTGYHESRGFLTVGYRPAMAPVADDSQQ